MAVDDARPMHDYVCEVGTELLEVDETTLAHIHKPETELVSLVGRAVAHDVHRPGELFESEKSVFVPVEALKNAVCQECILLLTQKPHDSSKLFFLHHPHSFLNFCTGSGIKYFYILQLWMAVKTAL